MLSNFSTAVVSGTGITLALFYVMQLLIAMQPGALADARVRHELNWVHVPPPEPAPKSIWEQKPEPIRDPPPIPDPVPGESEAVPVTKLPVPPPARPGNEGIDIAFGPSDGMLINIVRVRPVYPAPAIARGLEGYVVVQFDVMSNGTVANVSVVESSNRLFERSATEAAKRFRYRARVVEGVPQATYGIRYAFRFELDSD